MPTDDREQQFERALKRHLREVSPDSSCPDADVLAAYHERTLSVEEMSGWKEHIVTCERCQELLSLVERTENVDAEEDKEQDSVVLFDGAVERPAAYFSAGVKIPSPEKSLALPAGAAAPLSRAKRPGAQWKWIVPIGALAAGVIVWIGANEVHRQYHNRAESVEMAQNRQATRPAPVPANPPPESAGSITSAAPQAMTRSDQAPSRPVPRLPAPAAVPPVNEERERQKDARRPGIGYGTGAGLVQEPPPPAVAGALAKSGNQAVPAPNESAAVPRAAPADAARAPMAMAEAGRAGVADKLAANSRGGNLSSITGAVLDPAGAVISGAVITAIDTSTGSSKTTVADATGKFELTDLPSDPYRVVVAHAGFAQSELRLKLEPQRNQQLQVQLEIGSVSQTVEVSGEAAPVNTESVSRSADAQKLKASASDLSVQSRNFSELGQLASGNPRYLVAPGQKMVWRLGDTGKIERTTDNGKTWKRQKSGVTADLTSGAAVSGGVCWVVGKTGTILLTTDGGKHWKAVSSPFPEDLGGIHATDAQHASVWDVPSRNRYETSDGGATWKPVASQ